MSSKTPVIDAEHALASQCLLGEGQTARPYLQTALGTDEQVSSGIPSPDWSTGLTLIDPKFTRKYIMLPERAWRLADSRFDPETKKYSVDSYPETQYIGTIALRKDQPGVSYFRYLIQLAHLQLIGTDKSSGLTYSSSRAFNTLSSSYRKLPRPPQPTRSQSRPSGKPSK